MLYCTGYAKNYDYLEGSVKVRGRILTFRCHVGSLWHVQGGPCWRTMPPPPGAFTHSHAAVPTPTQARLGLQKDGLYLYRNCLPPAVPGLAFVGAEVSTFNNVLTSGLQAEWLARMVVGRIGLPSVEDMQADIRRQQR